MIEGYSKEDIVSTIQRIYDETKENRDRAIKLYDHMELAMLNNKGDLVVLSQMADRYLEQVTKQTELLVNLAQVMQRLLQAENKPNNVNGKNIVNNINQVLEQLDLAKLNPFLAREKGKVVVPAPKKPEPPQNENVKEGDEKSKPSDDVQLETDL